MNNKSIPYVLLLLSSIMLNLALIYPAHLAWLVYIFLVPIFYIGFKNPNAIIFKKGFFWGVTFFVVHLSGFVYLFYAQANSKLSIIIPILVSLYCALYAGAWFFLASYTAYMFNRNIVATFASWTIWTCLYFAWVRYGVLWILGKFVGYPFCHPMLPLASHETTIAFLSVFSKSLGFVVIILFALFIALYISFFKKRYLLCAAFLFASFFCSVWIVPQKKRIPKAITEIGYISPIKAQTYNHPIDAAQEIYYAMVELVDKKPNVNIIVMPESSYLFCLNERQDMIDMWYAHVLHEDVSLFIGAPYKDGNKIYNSLYWIKGGKIQKVYHKTNLMAFTEYVAAFWQKIPRIKYLFLDEDDFFSHGKDRLITFKLCKNINMKPLICSDFFIGKRKIGKQLKKGSFSAALIVVNDQAFPAQYLRDLMFLSAKLEAISRKKDILYVGYYFAAWISRCGAVLVL